MKKHWIILFIFLLILSLIPSIKASSYNPKEQKRAIWYNPMDVLPNNETEAKIKLYDDFKTYHDLNISDVFFLTLDTTTSYNSVYQDNNVFDYDALELAIETANYFNLSIHVWFCVARNQWLIDQNSSYAMIDKDLNPNNEGWIVFYEPNVKTHIFNMINELIHNYTIKGIHLDYIRFPDPNHSYDNYSRTTFQSEYGFDPFENQASPLWREWREAQVSNFVEDVKILVKSYSLNLQISCAVFPMPNDFNWALQKWENWDNPPATVDFLVFMAYTNSIDDFENFIKNAENRLTSTFPYYIGIGIYTIESSQTFIDEVKITWEYEVYGFCLFRDKYIYLNGFIDALIKIWEMIPQEPQQLWYENPHILAMVLIAVCVCVYLFVHILRKRAEEPSPRTH